MVLVVFKDRIISEKDTKELNLQFYFLHETIQCLGNLIFLICFWHNHHSLFFFFAWLNWSLAVCCFLFFLGWSDHYWLANTFISYLIILMLPFFYQFDLIISQCVRENSGNFISYYNDNNQHGTTKRENKTFYCHFTL